MLVITVEKHTINTNNQLNTAEAPVCPLGLSV